MRKNYFCEKLKMWVFRVSREYLENNHAETLNSVAISSIERPLVSGILKYVNIRATNATIAKIRNEYP